MTDLSELELLLPNQAYKLNLLLKQHINISSLVQCIKDYLLLNLQYNNVTKEIQLPMALTFTLVNWYVGLNCTSCLLRCLYSHTNNMLCGILYPSKTSNSDAYYKFMRVVLALTQEKFPYLKVDSFNECIYVTLNKDSSFENKTFSKGIITTSSLNVSKGFIYPSWEINIS
jgi:hypothetical protein